MNTGEWRVTGVENFPAGVTPPASRFFGQRVLNLTTPAGQPARYQGLDVRPCVHTVALTDKLTTVLVAQARPNAMRPEDKKVPWFLELPGGFADVLNEETGEVDRKASAAAELQEETGIRVASLDEIMTYSPYTGLSSEQDTLFLGRGAVGMDEFIERAEATEADMQIISGPFDEIYNMARRGKLDLPASGQAIASLAIAEAYLQDL